MNKTCNKFLLPGFLSITGLMFWFIVAFPFENRNESYSWIAQIEQSSFVQSLTSTFPSVITYRPLSQAMVWLLYHLANDGIYFIQMFNFIILILAMVLLVKCSKEILLTSFLLFFTGFIFFSSFYYLFHVHGIFYSPLILYSTYLILIKNSFVTNRKNIIVSCVITLLITAIHSYAIVIFIFFLAGQIFFNDFKINFSLLLTFVVASVILILIVLYDSHQSTGLNPKALIYNLKTSLYNVEVSGKLAPIAFLLSIVSVLWIKELKTRIIVLAFIFMLSILLYVFSFPILFVVILSAFFKLIIKKEWVLIAILISLVLFPSIVASGAPTKSSLMLPFLVFVISMDLNHFDIILMRQKYIVYWVLILMFLSIGILSRLHLQAPIVKLITKPILIEKEKTYQLESIINWYLNSPFNVCNLRLEGNQIPVNIKTLDLNREEIPPTKQGYLDEYLLVKKKELFIDTSNCYLIITFGNKSLPDKKIIKGVSINEWGCSKGLYLIRFCTKDVSVTVRHPI